MGRQKSKPKMEKIEGKSKTSIKKYQIKPFNSELDDIENQIISTKAQLNTNGSQKSNLFMKIIGLNTYSESIKGC